MTPTSTGVTQNDNATRSSLGRRAWRGTGLLVGGVVALLSLTSLTGGSASAANSVSVNPTTLEFGAVALGQSKSLPVVITNTGTTAATPNYAGGAPTDPTNFGGSQNCAGVELAAGASCQFTYDFTPTVEGPLTTTTTIEIDGVDFAITFSGIGGVDTTTTTAATTTTAPTNTTVAGNEGGGSGAGTPITGDLTTTSAPDGQAQPADAQDSDDDDSGPWLVAAIVIVALLVVAGLVYFFVRRARRPHDTAPDSGPGPAPESTPSPDAAPEDPPAT